MGERANCAAGIEIDGSGTGVAPGRSAAAYRVDPDTAGGSELRADGDGGGEVSGGPVHGRDGTRGGAEAAGGRKLAERRRAASAGRERFFHDGDEHARVAVVSDRGAA